MRRARTLRELSHATTPHQIAEAMWTARTWLLTHPDDEEFRDEMERLIEREREWVRA